MIFCQSARAWGGDLRATRPGRGDLRRLWHARLGHHATSAVRASAISSSRTVQKRSVRPGFSPGSALLDCNCVPAGVKQRATPLAHYPEMRKDDKLIFCMLRKDTLCFMLNQRTGTPVKPKDYEGIRLYWTPKDIRKTRDRLKGLGHDVSEVEHRDYGQTEFFLTDDDGFSHCFGVPNQKTDMSSQRNGTANQNPSNDTELNNPAQFKRLNVR